METDTTAAPPSRRPRTSLLVLLGMVLVVAAVVTLRDSADPVTPTSNPRRPQQQAAGEKPLDPAELDVRLEALKDPPPSPDNTERNPFRFRPKPPPPPPPGTRDTPIAPPLATGPRIPPPRPPIPLKFIGVVEALGMGKVAALTDCRHTVQGKEGEVIDGRYRIVKIGAEFLVIEYLDGKGRTTLRASGQDCVTK